jgi:hypothetical protein
MFAMADLMDLVEQWCGWMFQQGAFPNAGADHSGYDVMVLNRNNPVWFLPGAWKEEGIVRNILVPVNTPVLVIVASSHITKQELQRPKGTPPGNDAPPIPDPSNADLENRLRKIVTLWQRVELTIDGTVYRAPGQLRQTETDVCWMEINSTSPYITYTGIAGGLQPMKTAAYAVLIDTLGDPGTRHTIKLEGHARPDPPSGEIKYDLEVTYNILVVASREDLPSSAMRGGGGYTAPRPGP